MPGNGEGITTSAGIEETIKTAAIKLAYCRAVLVSSFANVAFVDLGLPKATMRGIGGRGTFVALSLFARIIFDTLLLWSLPRNFPHDFIGTRLEMSLYVSG